MTHAQRRELKAKLMQNGVPLNFWNHTCPLGKGMKKKFREIAMSRDPDNPVTPWAIRFTDEEKQLVREAWD